MEEGPDKGRTHVYLETDVLELKGVPETEAQVEVVEVKGIILEDVEPGHGIAKQTLRHGRGAEGLEDAGHGEDGEAAREGQRCETEVVVGCSGERDRGA